MLLWLLFAAAGVAAVAAAGAGESADVRRAKAAAKKASEASARAAARAGAPAVLEIPPERMQLIEEMVGAIQSGSIAMLALASRLEALGDAERAAALRELAADGAVFGVDLTLQSALDSEFVTEAVGEDTATTAQGLVATGEDIIDTLESYAPPPTDDYIPPVWREVPIEQTYEGQRAERDELNRRLSNLSSAERSLAQSVARRVQGKRYDGWLVTADGVSPAGEFSK